ncbi:MAG TPA: cellulase family glycosylhydrolase [Cellvibrionaceae bacterium]
MKKSFYLLICLCLHGLAIHSVAAEPADVSTFYVKGRHLYDPCGEQVVLMGPNKMVYWTDRTGLSSFTEIAKTGANTVRIVWTVEGSADELHTVLTNAYQQQLIPIIELHDATGDWSKLPQLVDYWTRPDIAAVIVEHQRYTLVNIGNEVGDKVAAEAFLAGYTTAVTRLREAGYRMPLMIDGTEWGKNIEILRTQGPALIEADPLRNLLFSVHMWWPEMWGYNRLRIREEIELAVAQQLPLVIGEFGNRWDDSEGGAIAWRTIVTAALEHKIGFLPWSWGPGNQPQRHLDMSTDGTYDGLTGWGRELMLDAPFAISKHAVRPHFLQHGQCKAP